MKNDLIIRAYDGSLVTVSAGDVLGFSGNDFLAGFVNLATWGLPFYSINHVAIAGTYRGLGLCLYESTTQGVSPCLDQGAKVSGVQVQDIQLKLRKYDGRAYLYKLVNPLNLAERENLEAFLRSQIGLPYDAIGAYRSAGYSAWEKITGYHENLNSLFCSEYVAAAHRACGRFYNHNASRWNPNAYLRSADHLLKPIRLK